MHHKAGSGHFIPQQFPWKYHVGPRSWHECVWSREVNHKASSGHSVRGWTTSNFTLVDSTTLPNTSGVSRGRRRGAPPQVRLDSIYQGLGLMFFEPKFLSKPVTFEGENYNIMKDKNLPAEVTFG